MLEHGGRVREAAARYNIPIGHWLDLSTGISPFAYSPPDLPLECWQRLPEENDGLETAAREYYGAGNILCVAGTQAAIQALPALRTRSRIGLMLPSYNEHLHAWKRHGHTIIELEDNQLDAAAKELDVILICNPNNPTGLLIDPSRLLQIAASLEARDGWLIVDEAFMDSREELSVARHTTAMKSLIVLRSLGKFFGLAGARVGFVCASPQLLHSLKEHLGPWTVAGPSRLAASAALNDREWCSEMRLTLKQASSRLIRVLSQHLGEPAGGTDLFQWIRTERAGEVHEALARCGVLTRLFQDPPSIRFGLPGSEEQWMRLERALKAVSEELACSAPVKLEQETRALRQVNGCSVIEQAQCLQENAFD